LTPRVLLIESLDAAGASPADARSRLDALERAGYEAEAVVCDHGRVALPQASVDPAGQAESIPVASDAAALQAVLDAHHDRLVLVASSAPGGGVVASWIKPGIQARWWPAGLHAGPRPLDRWRKSGLATLAMLDSGADAPCATAGLTWTPIEGGGYAPRRLSPWDGDYVLVPATLSAQAGTLALRVFARAAEERDALDLVFLAAERPDLEREARRLGIRTRVHFAGAAPRRAEYAWCHAAAAVMLGCDESLTGGVPLRALACGAPLLVLGNGPADRALRGWLDAAGCVLTPPGPGVDALEHTLGRLIDRDRQVEHAIGRGRELAELQEAKAFAPRLAAALRSDADARRRAA
jgi:hypothetical protein